MNSKVAVLGALLASQIAWSASSSLPSNVTTRKDGKAEYLEKVDFSFKATNELAFSKAKLCAAENVSNGSVVLSDSSKSFVGAATGNYYQSGNQSTVAGGGVFKYVDDASSTLIASGTTEAKAILTKDYIKFDVRLTAVGSDVGVVFLNISRAQQNTGGMANDGFTPVGTWTGARVSSALDALQIVADKIKRCLQS